MSAETAVAWWVHVGGQAAVLAVFVLAISAMIGHRLESRWRFGLWLVVLARLALPVTPAAPWSVFGLAVRASSEPPATIKSVRPRDVVAKREGDPPSVLAVEVVSAPATFPVEVPRETAPGVALTPGQALIGVWFVGIGALAVRQVWLRTAPEAAVA